MRLNCMDCGSPYPDDQTPYRCPRCGGIFDDVDPLRWQRADPQQVGIWRYESTVGPTPVRVSLGEANTPMVPAAAFGRHVFFKCEHLNPTGSFKDRGTAMMVSFLVSRGVQQAVEDSSGNAGASFAAYAARAGIHARIYVPESAAGQKRMQIVKYGAELVPVSGTRSAATTAALKAADGGAVYASHAYLPLNIAGYSTCAYEIYEYLETGPGALIVPAGQGGLLLGLGRGFKALRAAGVIQDLPVLIGVQAAVCAPLAAPIDGAGKRSDVTSETETVAEGVRVSEPVRAHAVLDIVGESGGRFVVVPEHLIMPGRDALGQLGFYVEPTSALVWHAMETTLSNLPDPVVIVLTGSGYKATN